MGDSNSKRLRDKEICYRYTTPTMEGKIRVELINKHAVNFLKTENFSIQGVFPHLELPMRFELMFTVGKTVVLDSLDDGSI